MKHLFLLVIAVGCAAESAGSRDGIPDGEREVRFPRVVDDHTVKVLGRDAAIPEFDAGDTGGAGGEAPLPDAGLPEEDAGSDAGGDAAMMLDAGEDPLEHQCEPCAVVDPTLENPAGRECPENYSCAQSHEGEDICGILADDAGVCPHPSLLTRGPSSGIAPNPRGRCLPAFAPGVLAFGPCDEWLEMYWGP